MNKLLVLFTLITFLGCQSSKEKQEDDPFTKLTQIFDVYGQETINKGNIPAIGLAFYKDGEVYHNYYGTTEKGSNKKPNDETLYEFASISKVFAGSLAARAVVEGKIVLDDPVQKYLGKEYTNLAFNGAPITIKHLLTHTLGFKDRYPEGLNEVQEKVSEGFYENKPFEYSMTNLLEELKTVELNKKPGSFYEYNSIGPELVAYILGQVYNKPYKVLLQEFLDELGMNNTYLQDFDTHKSTLLRGHKEDGKLAPLDKNPMLGGSAGMIGTLPDLVTFMKYQLESDDPLIKEATKELFLDQEGDGVGYLWEAMGIGEEEGFYYSKTGTSNSTQSGLLLCPDSNYGVILIGNNTSDEAIDNWLQLFFTKMENELIAFPKLNLASVLKLQFIEDKEGAVKSFNTLKIQEDKYYNTDLADALNSIGYDLMASEKSINKSIELITFATEKYPENANLFDSLGEAYFTAKDYNNSLLNFKKALKMNPKNEHAEAFITEIERLQSK